MFAAIVEHLATPKHNNNLCMWLVLFTGAVATSDLLPSLPDALSP